MQFFDLPGDHLFQPTSMAFSPNGEHLAVWEIDRLAIVNTTTETITPLWVEDGHMWGAPGVGFTADSQCVVAYLDHEVLVVNLTTQKVVRTFEEKHDSVLEPGPGGRLHYVIHHPQDQYVEIIPWDPLTGEQMPGIGKHKGFLRQLAISQDECWIAGAEKDEIRVWDIAEGKRPTRAKRRIKIEGPHWIHGLAMSSDGKYVAQSGIGVSVFDLKTGETWELSEKNPRFGRDVSFSPTCPLLAYGAGSEDVIFWDAENQREVNRYSWGIGEMKVTTFSPDGNRCAAGADGKVVIWDVV